MPRVLLKNLLSTKWAKLDVNKFSWMEFNKIHIVGQLSNLIQPEPNYSMK